MELENIPAEIQAAMKVLPTPEEKFAQQKLLELSNKSQQRWILIDDNDGHYYCIPVEQKDEFYKWVIAMESDMNHSGTNFENYSLGGDPSLLTFRSPVYAGKKVEKL